MIPLGLTRCGQCGQLKGEFSYRWNRDPEATLTTVLCLCDGIVCRRCGKGVIHRPIWNFYDEATGEVWYVP